MAFRLVVCSWIFKWLLEDVCLERDRHLQGFLAHKNTPSPRTMKWDSILDPMVVLGMGAYLVGAPVLSDDNRSKLYECTGPTVGSTVWPYVEAWNTGAL